MAAIVLRVGILALVSVITVIAVRVGQALVRRQQRLVQRATRFVGTAAEPVRILAFHTEDCTQCRTHQAPALERVAAARPGQVRIIDVDALAEPELARQYRVMTVPTTVVLDRSGQAIEVNYGLANTTRLLTQVDGVLAGATATAAAAS